ncbi:MAG: metalloregulator ArsR/SmtB family transcription factor [Chloroflexi bacterium]|nr:metalloregulator ArsR/SmtB family transcription factor [Chloroflexota bacterium]
MKRALDPDKPAPDPDIRLLQAAADPTRLAILRQLSGKAAVCACEFTACCNVAQPTVSHHLRVLREAGWVTSERRGSWVHYSLSPDAVARFGALAGGLAPGTRAASRPRAVAPARRAQPAARTPQPA